MPSKFLRTEATLQHLGRLAHQPPVCDFCGEHAPRWIYAAERTTSGLHVRCWRWCACPECAELIEAERWADLILKVSAVLQRAALNRLPPRMIRQAVDEVMSHFHRWSIRNPPGAPCQT